MRDSNNSRCQPTLCTLPFVCNLAWLCFNLGCLLFLCSVSFVFKIYRLLFPSLLGFVHLDCLSCTRSASFVFLTRLVDSFARSRWRILLSCRLLGCIWIAPAFVFVPRSVLSFRPPLLFPTNISFVFDHGQTIKIAAQLGWVPRSCTPRYCSTRFWWRVLLSCRLARLDLNTIQHFVKDRVLWRLHWPYFFLLDVSRALSSYCSHIQVRRWRRMDAKDARRGFMRRETAKKILRLAAFDEMNCSPRDENILYSGSLQNTISPAVLFKSQRQRGGLLEGFLALPGHRFELGSSVNSLRYRQISKIRRVYCVCPGPGSV